MNSSSRLFAGILLLTASVAAHAIVRLTPAGDGHDTVPVFVNGHGPYPFVLDSGADSSAVYQWFARKEHFKVSRHESLSGQTGASDVPMYKVGDLALDGRHLRHVTAFGFPDRHDAGREAGVIGNDLMDGALVVFDFPCRSVSIQAKPSDLQPVTGAAPAIQAGIDKGTSLLTLAVTINGFTGIAALDTGSRVTRLTPAFARMAGINASSAKFHDASPIYGANSRKMIPRRGPIGTVRLGGFEIRNAEAEVIDLPMLEHDFGGKPAMLLGADLLARYRLIYDHSARKIWLARSRCAVQS